MMSAKINWYKSSTVVIDAQNMLYRAYWAVRGLKTSGGRPTNAIYGMLGMIKATLEHFNRKLVVVWDGKGETWRHKLAKRAIKAGVIFMPYKATRVKSNEILEELYPQIDYIVDAIKYLGLRQVICPGMEADDLIGAVCDKFDGKKIIISTDKDFFQLISREVRVYNPRRYTLYSKAKIRREYGIHPKRFVDVGALMGDATDCIEGIRGIGEKTALKLIKHYGSLKEILADLDNLAEDDRWVAEIRDNLLKVKLAYKLKKIAPYWPGGTELLVQPPNFEKFGKLMKEMEIKGYSSAVFKRALGTK